MSEFIELMYKPFLACLILTGIHAYLGIHVIKRGVIFVDLALAQLAAVGTTVGFLIGWGLHSTENYFCSLIFTLIGAGIFSFTRFRLQSVPQEAIIGVVYAVASAASILILSNSANGGEELKSLMVGHLLFVEWKEIIPMMLIYSFIGAIHWRFRHPFIAISENATLALNQGIRVRLWDFLFYATFGIVVTSSTNLAGVLLVFSFLVVPASCAMLLANTIKTRLLVGWSCGIITSIIGTSASYYLDLPTGATIVCCFGLSLVCCWALSLVRNID